MDAMLPLIWSAILGFVIITYVVLDGFDLGIGILFTWVDTDVERDIMMNTVAPVWDGNATWLILGAAFLYGTFPVAYSALLTLLYMPIMIMLAALIFRGIAFEFRFKAHRGKHLWDFAFMAGSTMVAFCQGAILGTFIQGFHRVDGIADPSLYAWLTPFSFATGIAVIVGYGLLGATWLIMRCEGELQAHMYDAAKLLLMGVTIFLAYVSFFTPYVEPDIANRWFSFPNMLYLAPIPLATLFLIYKTWYALGDHRECAPFFYSVGLFILPYIGLGVSLYPYIVPYKITIWDAASPAGSLKFMLVGAVILLPTLLIYTAYAYRVFRGKVTADTHHYYH